MLSVANPERSTPRHAGLGPEQEAHFPKYLRERFRERKFAEADPPSFLDKPGAEVLLVSAGADAKRELGIGLVTKEETGCNAEVFRDLKIDCKHRHTAPLFEGKWRQQAAWTQPPPIPRGGGRMSRRRSLPT